MDELETLPPTHFSKKIFFLSLLIFLINVAFFALIFSSGRGPSYRAVAPRLVFSDSDTVLMKTPFDADFRAAASEEAVRPGTQVKTGADSSAELQLEGDRVRLDQNTLLILEANPFEAPSFLIRPEAPRLILTLRSGAVWVNAHEPVRLKTPFSHATFAQAVGSFTYADPMNRVMAIQGGVELVLNDKKGEGRASYFVPFRHQVTFFDSQITPNYAKLQPSKLKKELKLAPLAKAVLEDDWVLRNQEQDLGFLKSHRQKASSFYRAWDGLYKTLERVTFIPETKRQLRLKRLENHLRFVVTFAERNEEEARIKSLLQTLDPLALVLAHDPALSMTLAREFYGMGYPAFDSPAFLVKEKLRGELLKQEDNPYFLRTYLLDLGQALKEEEPQVSLSLLELWLKQWEKRASEEENRELENQSQLVHRLLLAYPKKITPDLVGVLEALFKVREASARDPKEFLFSVAEEYADLASSLIETAHYSLAKTVLQAAHQVLQKPQLQGDASARAVMLERVALLTERIAFAQAELHGAALDRTVQGAPIDETQFRDYLELKSLSGSLFEKLDPSLLLEADDSANRARITAQDLSLQRVLEAFRKAGIEIGTDAINLLDFSNLDRFRMEEVKVQNPKNPKQMVRLSFDFNLSINKVVGARFLENDIPLPSSIVLSDLVRVVFGVLNSVEQEKNLLKEAARELKTKGLFVAPDKLQAESGERVRFTALSVPALPLEVSGVYDHATRRFSEVSHELLRKTDTSIEDYFNELAPLFVLNFLKGKGIMVTPEQLSLVFPFDRIQVTGFTAGKSRLDFQVNFKASRLEAISIQGTNSTLQNMTFDEFKGVLKTLEQEE